MKHDEKKKKKIKRCLCELEFHNCVTHSTDIHKRLPCQMHGSLNLFFFIYFFIINYGLLVCFPVHYGFHFSIVLIGVSDVES